MEDTIQLKVPGSRKRLRVATAARWRSAMGLLGNGDLNQPHGLWVQGCRRVHTIGLVRTVDVVFLRPDGVVAKVVSRMKPWRTTACREASAVLELRPGLAERLRIAPGVALDLLS
jgi:uncharacterized membrane protein (UPF0127 family)